MGGYYYTFKEKSPFYTDAAAFVLLLEPPLTSLHTLYICVPHVELLIPPSLCSKHVHIL
jgi:hypothetical protein